MRRSKTDSPVEFMLEGFGNLLAEELNVYLQELAYCEKKHEPTKKIDLAPSRTYSVDSNRDERKLS